MKTKDGGFILDYKHSIFGLYSSQCMYCRHFITDGYQCSAFPLKITDNDIQSIPDDILSGESPHEVVRKDQEGDIVFEPNEDCEKYGLPDFLTERWNPLR
ncbi:MAG: hypothetical protein LBI60_06695 [Bacteroidales bacterium]|jgi:hypothetical protein|nr:hypothetical protein [Bacteroidales bacterium]